MLRYVLAASSLLSGSAFAESDFVAKIHLGQDRTAAIINYGRSRDQMAFCQVTLLNHEKGNLFRCRGYEAPQQPENPDDEGKSVSFTGILAIGGTQIEGVVTYSGPAGYTEAVVSCPWDDRGFYGCTLTR